MGKEEAYQLATRDVLLSASKIIGEVCVEANLAFGMCKAKNEDPEACLKEGAAILKCGNNVLRKLDAKCPAEFEAYRKCMDAKQMKHWMCHDLENALRAAFSSK